MKKKILFIIPGFYVGGTISSLKSLCSIIDRDRYEINIFALTDCGPLKKDFLAYNIVKESIILSAYSMNYSEEKRFFRKILSFFLKSVNTILGFIFKVSISDLVFRIGARKIKADRYDTVIAFQEGAATNVAKYIVSQNKIAWVHCDYSRHIEIFNISPEVSCYERFHKIVCVSEYTKQKFCNLIPSVRTKTISIHNVLDDNRIKELSLDDSKIDDRFIHSDFTIISIGRLDPVKRFEMIPALSQQIRSLTDRKFRWYIIGGGELHDVLTKRIIENEVEDTVFCLGQSNNPYSYLSKVDLLVSTSISEACPNVINEAKILHIPVVSADFGSAVEMVDNGVNGVICPIEEIAPQIARMINDKPMYDGYKERIGNYKYDNSDILKQMYKIL